jgi:hypothetical protein
MTTKADFTPEEWKTIFTAAPMAGLAITAASPSGPFGVIKEMFAVGHTIGETLQKGSQNPLISALIADMKARGTKPDRPQNINSPQDAENAALDNLRKVSEILATKAPGPEGDEFKRWIVGIAKNVAEASNEGGFLGFGGTKVSDAEKAALQKVAQALGVPDAAA